MNTEKLLGIILTSAGILGYAFTIFVSIVTCEFINIKYILIIIAISAILLGIGLGMINTSKSK